MEESQPANCKIAALSNPLSGKNKRGGAFAAFEHTLAQYPQISHIAVSNPADITAALHRFEQDNIGLIIVNGGDGTLQTVLTYLQHVRDEVYKPKLALLKAGTTSMAFGDVGCKGKLNEVLKHVLLYASGSDHRLKEVSRAVLRMRIPKSGQTICGLFFGAGAVYSGILYCRQNLHTKGLRGELGPTLAMARFLLDWITANKLTTPAHATIIVDDTERFSGEFNVIVATTLKRLLIGVYPFWADGDRSNHQVLSIIKRHPPRPLKAYSNILRGRRPNVEITADYYRSYCPATVKIEINSGFTLDGELFGDMGISSKIVLDTAGTVSFLIT